MDIILKYILFGIFIKIFFILLKIFLLTLIKIFSPELRDLIALRERGEFLKKWESTNHED